MKIFGLNISRARETKASSTWTAVMSPYSNRTAVYTPKNYAELSKSGYQICATSYACVSLIARSCAGIKWTVSKKQSDGTLVEFEEHPLLDLLMHPNEYDSGYRLIEAIISYKLLNGNSYVEKVHGLRSMPPRFLYALRPDRMTIKPGDAKGLVRAYTYEVNGLKVTLDKENILHLKDFHPLHDLYGLSKVEVAMASIDISNASQEWNLKHLQNDMHLSGLLTLKGLTADQSKQIQAQFREKYQGYQNAGKVAVMENIDSADFQQLSMTPRDADWGESEKRNLRRICSVFNIWSGLLGDNENTTYSNMQEGRKALYQEAVLPEMDGLCDAFNHFLVESYGDNIVLGYDRDKIEALQEDREKKYGYLEGCKFLTLNEKRAAVGYDEIVGGDVILVPLSDIPLSDTGLTQQDDPDKDADAGADTGKMRAIKAVKKSFWTADVERKARFWNAFEKRVTSQERAFVPELEKYFAAQAKRVAAKIGESSSVASVDVASIFDAAAEAKAYVDRFTSRYLSVFDRAKDSGRRATKGEAVVELEAAMSAPKAMTPDQMQKIKAQIEFGAQHIHSTIFDDIRAAVVKAATEASTVAELSQAVADKLDDYKYARARTVARTEMARTENFGNLEGFKESGTVELKGWMCSFVPDSREAHMKADGEEVPIDSDFVVGNESLAYPGDPRGSAENVVQCLCTTYPVVREE